MKLSIKNAITNYFKLISPGSNDGIIVTYVELTNKWKIVLVCPEHIFRSLLFETRPRRLKTSEIRLKTQMKDMFPYEFDVMIIKEWRI